MFNPYPSYKDSGIEWLGKIPAHWALGRLRSSITNYQNGVWGDEPDGVNDIPCIRVADFDRINFKVNVNSLTLRKLTGKEASTRLIKNGDLLLEKSGGGDNQPVGAIILFDHDMRIVCSNFIARMKVNSAFSGRFLSYLNAALYRARVNVRSIKQNTGIQNLDSDSYLREVVAYPSIDEQHHIAELLDRATNEIDALIGKKERLIELLQEKRTALITQAVTKGLDPNVPMKDSGVEWLGKIPAHWSIMKTTWLFSIGSGTTPQAEELAYYGGETPWLTTSELRESVVMSTNKNVTAEALRDLSSLKVYPPGSVVVAMYGATIGRLGILGIPMTVNQACCVFAKPRGIDTSFWYYWLQMRRSHLISLGYGGGQPNLSQELLRAIRVPTPPYPEQHFIADFLEREIEKIDALVAKIQEAIERLKEFRTALITDAVTGKIDVREARVSAQESY